MKKEGKNTSKRMGGKKNTYAATVCERRLEMHLCSRHEPDRSRNTGTRMRELATVTKKHYHEMKRQEKKDAIVNMSEVSKLFNNAR